MTAEKEESFYSPQVGPTSPPNGNEQHRGSAFSNAENSNNLPEPPPKASVNDGSYLSKLLAKALEGIVVGLEPGQISGSLLAGHLVIKDLYLHPHFLHRYFLMTVPADFVWCKIGCLEITVGTVVTSVMSMLPSWLTGADPNAYVFQVF